VEPLPGIPTVVITVSVPGVRAIAYTPLPGNCSELGMNYSGGKRIKGTGPGTERKFLIDLPSNSA
jgi:hypothetical protein